MKRSPLKRKTALKAKTALKPGGELKRTPLAPVSAKGRVSRQRDRAQVAAEGAAFKAAVRGMRCVMCGTTDGIQAHHAVPQQTLRRRGRTDVLWHPHNAVPLCVRDHARHTTRFATVPFERLPAAAIAFAYARGLVEELLREHPRGQVG